MKIPVEAIINFQGGRAEVSLPKGATGVQVTYRNCCFYLCATADPDETEKEKYLLFSRAEEMKSPEKNGFIFLREVNILGAGNFFWYYQKVK